MSVAGDTGWPASCSGAAQLGEYIASLDRKSTRLNSSHPSISISTLSLHALFRSRRERLFDDLVGVTAAFIAGVDVFIGEDRFAGEHVHRDDRERVDVGRR